MQIGNLIIGAHLSKPHTSERNGTSVMFTKIYMKIWINGTSIMHSQNLCLKIGLKLDNLQMLPDVFIGQTITRAVY